MKKLEIPEIQGDSLVWDFVNAAERINENWATGIHLQLTLSADQNKDFTMDLPALILNLRTFQRSIQVAHGQSTTTAFHAARPIPTYICGEKHWFNECNYLMDSPPTNWTPNPDKALDIKVELHKNPALQEKINKALAKQREYRTKKAQKPTTTASF